MNFKWSTLNKPVYVLAPMANVTTLPFRSICREMGADIVYTPMVSSNAIIHNESQTLKIAEFLPSEQPVIVQIFGYSGELIAKAAKIIERELRPSGIDINMGCPAPKIVGNECGSALLKNYDKALEIAKEVREGYKGQLSVKLRLGWESFDVLPFAKKLEKIGVDAISIHGRTAKQGYRGSANWVQIKEVNDSLSIPVLGNGDISSWKEALERTEMTPSGVMIGRASLGNPWIFQEISNKRTLEISLSEKAEIIEKQAELYIKYAEETRAMMEMRKYLGWYLKGFAGSLKLRKQAMQIMSYKDLDLLLSNLKNLEN